MSTRRSAFPFSVLLAAVLLLPHGDASSAGAKAAAAPSHDPASAAAAGRLMFIENAGQFSDGARFQVRGRDFTLWLAEDAIWLTLFDRTAAQSPTVGSGSTSAGSPPSRGLGVNIKLTLLDANPHPRLESFNRLETHVSFFTGSDSAKWRAGVPAWGGVRYVELYPGIDLEFTGEQGRLMPRLAARPGADLSGVRLRVEGADAVAMESDTLRLSTAAGPYSLPLLRAEGSNAQATVQPRGVLAFEVTAPFAPEDRKPVSAPASADDSSDLLYSTFLGGSSDEVAYGIAVDASGAAYVTGYTLSSAFPTTYGAFDTSLDGSYDLYVVKLNGAGSALVYATFVGGSSGEWGQDIAVDDSGAAYVTGRTGSNDFPATPDAFDQSFNSSYWYDYDAFVVKLNAAGSVLAYATYLGGSYNDNGAAIAVDGNGAAYVTGWTGSDYGGSSNFPTTPGALDTTHNGGGDAFVAKLNEAGSALDYATFLGGNDMDAVCGIAVDESGAAYVTGWTGSNDFPTTPGALDTTRTGGLYEGFVAKLNAAGSGLDYATYLGGSSDEQGFDIAVDGSGAAYVAGTTGSSDFPTTPGAFDTSFNGPTGAWGDAFVVKLNAAGSALDYGTFLGGSSQDAGQGIAVDGSGAAYVTGWAGSPELPTTCGAFDRSYNGGYDLFVAKLNAAGAALDYATFLGGSSQDMGGGDFDRRGNGIAEDGSGRVYVTGTTASSDFPTTPAAFDTSYNGGDADAFVAKLSIGAPYAICGRVTGTGGQGISDVTVSAGPGGSAITGTSGDFTINNLSTGTYTLTPALEGRRFDPITRSVDVPPDADGQDFELVPFSVYLPLVLRNH